MAINNLESPQFKAVYAAGATSGTPGEALASGKVYVYAVGGTYNNAGDQATIWTDKAKTTPHSQPVVLDAAGEAEIWFDGTYDIRVDSSSDELQYTLSGAQSSIGAGASTANASILNNGSFETDTDSDGAPNNWTLVPETSAVIAIDTTNVTDGVNSLKFNGAGSGGGTATSDKFPITEGETISVAWSFYATHATTTNTFQIKWYDEDDVFQSTSTLTMPASGAVPTSWTKYTEEVTADAAATQGEVVLTGISAAGANLSEDAYFDGISIIPTTTIVTKAATQTLTNKTLTNPTVTTGSFANPAITIDGTGTIVDSVNSTSIDAIYDEDNMASNDVNGLATQQSIKAYVDNVIQVVETTYATYTSTSSVILNDDTIPTTSEGLELITQAITPVYSTSKLEVSFDALFGTSTAAQAVVTLLDKTGDTVLKTFAVKMDAVLSLYPISGSIIINSPGTSANTYSMRIGTNTGTLYTNGDGSSRRYGGSTEARLTVKEIA